MEKGGSIAGMGSSRIFVYRHGIVATVPQFQLHVPCCGIRIETIRLYFLEPQALVEAYCGIHASEGVKPHFLVSHISCPTDERVAQAAACTSTLVFLIYKQALHLAHFVLENSEAYAAHKDALKPREKKQTAWRAVHRREVG